MGSNFIARAKHGLDVVDGKTTLKSLILETSRKLTLKNFKIGTIYVMTAKRSIKEKNSKIDPVKFGRVGVHPLHPLRTGLVRSYHLP